MPSSVYVLRRPHRFLQHPRLHRNSSNLGSPLLCCCIFSASSTRGLCLSPQHLLTHTSNSMPPPPVLPVSPEELEFFAEEELIQIVPNCSVPGDFIDGVLERYGPFRPQQVVEVPVWLALQFHKRNKARIILPEWLSSKQLSESIEQERSSPDAFSQQPYYFMELACLLLEHAKACFASNDECMQVRDKLANLVNVRRHKMEEGLHQIGSTATVRVNGLGAYELNLIRANFQGALNMFLKLETAEAAVAVRPPMSSTYGSTSFA